MSISTYNTEELKELIDLLEEKKEKQEEIIIEDLNKIAEDFKPKSLLKNTLLEIVGVVADMKNGPFHYVGEKIVESARKKGREGEIEHPFLAKIYQLIVLSQLSKEALKNAGQLMISIDNVIDKARKIIDDVDQKEEVAD